MKAIERRLAAVEAQIGTDSAATEQREAEAWIAWLEGAELDQLELIFRTAADEARALSPIEEAILAEIAARVEHRRLLAEAS